MIHTNSINNMIHASGYLELIIGPMFSGKTSELISLSKQYTLSKMNTCVINNSSDTRYHKTLLSTHDKLMIPCINTNNICDALTPSVIQNHSVFLINEGQFFTDLYESVISLVETHHKIVHVCGLDGDFKRAEFGQLLKLIPMCDNIVKKTAICSRCEDGTKGLFSHRIGNETSIKIIGSSGYMSVCRNCYLKLNTTKQDSITDTDTI